MKTSKLDFNGCTEREDFYDRIIDALNLGVGYCGRNFDAIYDFSRSEKIPDKVEIVGMSSLKGYLATVCSERMLHVFERIKGYYKQYDKVFEYEIID